jgi:hypothetical protein
MSMTLFLRSKLNCHLVVLNRLLLLIIVHVFIDEVVCRHSVIVG